MRRAIIVMMDSCGAGEAPDAAEYGDEGSDTLGHTAAAVGGLDLPNLQRGAWATCTAPSRACQPPIRRRWRTGS